MAIAFACGLLVAFGPAIGLGRLLVSGSDDVGAGEAVGADDSATPTVAASNPAVGADPDAAATADPVYSEVPRTDQEGSSTSGSQGGSGGAGAASGSAAGVAPGASASSLTCPSATVTVSTAEQLEDALLDAEPGDVIRLADGVYDGEFRAAVSGTSSNPIYLCGGSGAILDGDGHSGGYVFHLDGARYWRLLGFTVRNGQKGVMADGTVGSVIAGLTIYSIGDEALHLRRHSTDNTVSGNTIYDTGNRREKYGEGIYVGTAESNWCDITDCQPDRSDRNLIEGNTIYNVTAEAVDIKEGTTGGTLRGNSFDGSAMTSGGGDSWVDVKGNNWIIEDNVGANSSMDGFQVHEILDGWGRGNRFRDNTATVNGPGFGFSLTPVRDNVVECSNSVQAASEGYANVSCS